MKFTTKYNQYKGMVKLMKIVLTRSAKGQRLYKPQCRQTRSSVHTDYNNV